MRAVAHLIVLLVHLESDPALDQILAEDVPGQQEIVIGRQGVQSLFERRGQRPDRRPLLICPGKDVGIYRAEASLGGINPAADAVQSSQELRGQRQVGVAGDVRRAELEAYLVRLSGVAWDAYGGTPVADGRDQAPAPCHRP